MASCYDNVPAPTDANGIVVPLDTKELVRKGETLKVYGFDYSAMLKAWFVKLEEYGYTRLGACTLPDSWERLEADVERLADGYDVCDYFKGAGRKAYDCGHEDGFCCDLCVARDILRRARGLAGMDAND